MNEPHHGIGKAYGTAFEPMRPGTRMTPDIPADRDPQKMGHTGSSFASVPKSVHSMSASERAILRSEKEAKQTDIPVDISKLNQPLIQEETMTKSTPIEAIKFQLKPIISRLINGRTEKEIKAGLPGILDETYGYAASLFKQGLSWGEVNAFFVENGLPPMPDKSFRDAMFRARLRFERRQREAEYVKNVSEETADRIIETARAEEQVVKSMEADRDHSEIMNILADAKIEHLDSIKNILDDAVRKVIEVASIPTPPVIVRETIRIRADDPRVKDLLAFVDSGFAPDRVSLSIRMLLSDIMEKPAAEVVTD